MHKITFDTNFENGISNIEIQDRKEHLPVMLQVVDRFSVLDRNMEDIGYTEGQYIIPVSIDDSSDQWGFHTGPSKSFIENIRYGRLEILQTDDNWNYVIFVNKHYYGEHDYFELPDAIDILTYLEINFDIAPLKAFPERELLHLVSFKPKLKAFFKSDNIVHGIAASIALALQMAGVDITLINEATISTLPPILAVLATARRKKVIEIRKTRVNYNVSLNDLAARGYLAIGDKLEVAGNYRENYTGRAEIVSPEQGVCINCEDILTPYPSTAAKRITGRGSENGWMFWARQHDGKRLSEIREDYEREILGIFRNTR